MLESHWYEKGPIGWILGLVFFAVMAAVMIALTMIYYSQYIVGALVAERLGLLAGLIAAIVFGILAFGSGSVLIWKYQRRARRMRAKRAGASDEEAASEGVNPWRPQEDTALWHFKQGALGALAMVAVVVVPVVLAWLIGKVMEWFQR
jgi:hypothetical protein